MKFLYPQFLWALSVLAVPLIIHLFNFRRYSTLYFSDTRLLQNVVKKSKAINRLRQILIMLARMFALAALVIAFANPFIPADDTVANPGEYASVYVDNSPSMLSGPQQTSLLSKARNQAVKIIQGLPQHYKVQVITNDFSGRQGRFYGKTEAVELIDEIQPSYAFRTAGEILAKIEQAAEPEKIERLDVFLISDFQRSVFDAVPSVPEEWRMTLLPVNLLNESQNISIDSVWFDNPVLQPGFDQVLQVQLRNSGGGNARQVSVNLNIEDELQGAREIEIPASGKANLSFTIRSEKASFYNGFISVDAGSPYFDNKFYFSYSVAEPFKILLTGTEEHQSRFARLFSDSIYDLSYASLTAIDYSQMGNYDLVILDEPDQLPTGLIQSLDQHLEGGKNVILVPGKSGNEGPNSLLLNIGLPALGSLQGPAKALDVQWNDPHFKEVFTSTPDRPSLPTASSYYSYNNRTGYPLIKLENGAPLVSRLPVKSGDLILVTSPLSESGLLNHPIFVPLMLNAALYSRQNTPLYTLSGLNSGPAYNTGDLEGAVSILDGDQELIPRQRIKNGLTELFNLPSELEPGNYTVMQGENNVGYLALNIPPDESKWVFLSEEDVSEKFNINTDDVITAEANLLEFNIRQKYEGTPLWKWFVGATLLFLLIEIALIKFWK